MEAETPVPVGEAAALACAVCWSLSAVFFTNASRRAGASAVNQFRLLLACVFLGAMWSIAGWASGFDAVPHPRQAALLGLSGLVGLALGDAALFRAFVILGARRVMLLTALAPVFVAVLAVLFLDETLGPVGWTGMAVTLAGVAWVVLDRTHVADPVHGSLRQGLVLGVLAALGQAAGGVLSKAGLGQAPPGSVLGTLAAGSDGAAAVSPLAGTFVRMLAGCAAYLAFSFATGRGGHMRQVTGDRRTLGWTVAGTVVGPFVGVWLSLVAFSRTEAAVAQTLLALTPVLVLPVHRLLTGESAARRAYVGAAVAVLGAVLLALRHRLGG